MTYREILQKFGFYSDVPKDFTGSCNIGGDIVFYKNGKNHREDGPAIDYKYGAKEWYLNGKKHRVDGPAIEHKDGSKEWYIKGKLHRTDGPAIEYANGTKFWYLNDKRHREDGPAKEFINGTKEWYLNGNLHREDGPAVEYADGRTLWYIDGNHVSKELFNEKTMQKFKYKKDIPKKFNGYCTITSLKQNNYYKNGKLHREDGPAIEYEDGRKEWYLNGKLHRTDGPAIELPYAEGAKYWYLNGKHHREDGPAIEYANGDKYWYKNGKQHRLDGPAIELASGTKHWLINGNKVSKEELEEFNIKEFAFSYNVPSDFTGICKIKSLKQISFYKDGKSHRENGPAIEYENGDKEWWINGQLHREDGPAIMHRNKSEYWLYGKQYSQELFTEKLKEVNIKKFESTHHVPVDFTGICKINKSKCYYKDGKLHREDGPAIEYENGDKYWYINGKRHRENGPAIERATVGKEWFVNGDRHREDGPAIEYASGDKYWHKNNQLHRTDGPAVEFATGKKTWYQNGKHHRLDGPATEYPDGYKEWYIEDKNYSESKFNEKIANMNIKNFKYRSDIPKDFTGVCEITSLKEKIHYKDGKFHREDGPAVEGASGTKEWYLNGVRHREDRPAVECADGDKEWIINGQYHRLDGPAIERTNGYKAWYIQGKRHREDGPAIEYSEGDKEWYQNGYLNRLDGPACEYANGDKHWYIEGKKYSKEEFTEKTSDMNISRFKYINDVPTDFTGVCEITSLKEKIYYKNGEYHRVNGPAIECADGTKYWYLNGKLHREDGPAVEASNGDKEWFINGQRHRENGPAREFADGAKEWFINGKLHRLDGPAAEWEDGKQWFIEGKEYSEEEFNKKMSVQRFTFVTEVPKDFTGICQITHYRETHYYKDGELHREDGPAIECVTGRKEWYKNGKRHRLDGPACEYDAYKKAWYIEDDLYSEVGFNKKVASMNVKEFKYESDVPKDFTGICNITDLEQTRHYKDGKMHNENGPAVEATNGDKWWFINGKNHREDGPAVEYTNGYKRWYLDGMHYSKENFDKIKTEKENIVTFNNPNDVPANFTGICRLKELKQIRHYKDKKIHNENGPAIIWNNGEKEWYINNQKHQEDGPAVEGVNGTKWWYKNDQLHREDGPAIEYSDGAKEWYLNGKCHREDGPAVEYASGNKVWYQNNEIHRINGPAIEYADGSKSWYIEGTSYSEEQFNEKIANMNLKHFKSLSDVPNDFTGVCNINDKTYHFDDGKIHKENGPAIESETAIWWYNKGQMHREDGPAFEDAYGDKEWWLDGSSYSEEKFKELLKEKSIVEFDDTKNIPENFTGCCKIISTKEIHYYKNGYLHREDGPAVLYSHNVKEWYKNGQLHREDGPAIEFSANHKMWYMNDELHREDGPAIERPDVKEWYIHSKRHRTDGPAVEYADGTKRWWIDGENYSEQIFNQKIANIVIEFENLSNVPKDFTGFCKIKQTGDIRYYKNGLLHREGGPAIEYENGSKKWLIDGVFHREDGPAIEDSNGYKAWYKHDKLHREDGPAVEHADHNEYWINGFLLDKKDFENFLNIKYQKFILKDESKKSIEKLQSIIGDSLSLDKIKDEDIEKIKDGLKNVINSITTPEVQVKEMEKTNTKQSEKLEIKGENSEQANESLKENIEEEIAKTATSEDKSYLNSYYSYYEKQYDKQKKADEEKHEVKISGLANELVNSIDNISTNFSLAKDIMTEKDVKKIHSSLDEISTSINEMIKKLATPSNPLEKIYNEMQAKEKAKQVFNKNNYELIIAQTASDIPPQFSGIIKVVDDYSIRFFKNGLLHRNDGPAIEYADGTQKWFINGVNFNPTQEVFKGLLSLYPMINNQEHIKAFNSLIEEKVQEMLKENMKKAYKITPVEIPETQDIKKTEDSFSYWEKLNPSELQKISGNDISKNIQSSFIKPIWTTERPEDTYMKGTVNESKYDLRPIFTTEMMGTQPIYMKGTINKNQTKPITDIANRLKNIIIEKETSGAEKLESLISLKKETESIKDSIPAEKYLSTIAVLDCFMDHFINNFSEDESYEELEDDVKDIKFEKETEAAENNNVDSNSAYYFDVDDSDNKESNLDRFKRILIKSGYKISAETISQVIKHTLIAILEKYGNVSEEIMNSKAGEIILQSAVGVTMLALSENEHLENISYEMLVSSIAKLENTFIDVVMDQFQKEKESEIRIMVESLKSKQEEEELCLEQELQKEYL